MGPQAMPDIGLLFFCIKNVFKITEIIEPTGCFNQNHVSLVFDDYKLSLQWGGKKKKFSARKIIPPCGQTDSSQMGTRAHSARPGTFPLAGHTDLCSLPSCTRVLRAASLSKCPRPSHAVTAHDEQPRWRPRLSGWKHTQGLSAKVLLLLSRGATSLSSLPIRNNLVLKSLALKSGLKNKQQKNTSLNKNDFARVHSRCVPADPAAAWELSLEGEII